MSRASADATPRRILFFAENFAGGNAAEELALWLAGRGYAIDAIAAEGSRVDDASGWWRVEERLGIRVTRCPRRRAALPRGFFHQLQLASFALASVPVLLSRARDFRPHLLAAERFAAAAISSDRGLALPSWVDTRRIHPLPEPSALRDTLGLAPDAVV